MTTSARSAPPTALVERFGIRSAVCRIAARPARAAAAAGAEAELGRLPADARRRRRG
ncbi:MAG TPA: hypothetical protein VEL75_07735 [Candidatus Methylomirabilis sp.]|nr:hypothetical protein [Candidatus Methylomirabilis sp.]